MSRLLPVLALLAGCIPESAIGERLDPDGDGAVSATFGGTDCDDEDAAIHPGAVDVPGDAVDQDCDGQAFCPDGDGDEDGVCDADDACAAGPDGADADADGVPDACDTCEGDDREDLDADTIPDACDTDDDGDDVPDEVEVAYGSDPRAEDSDGDGLLDGVENADRDAVVDPSETDASAADTDDDGLCDGDDVALTCVGAEGLEGTSPTDADTDADGLLDGDEVTRTNTFPLLSDSDADLLPDGLEDETGTSPTDDDSDDDGWKDGGEDSDRDGVVDATETDPRTADTDEDGLDDPDEAGTDGVIDADETDPTVADTDDDGVLDGAEASGDFDADGKVDARDRDSDDDGLHDGAEVEAGTDAHDPDSDDDTLSDGDEVNDLGTDPLLADSDDDDLDDAAEVALATDPLVPDTDDDGLLDGDEVARTLTDPLVADTDGDGLDDGVEDAGVTDALDADTDDDALSDGVEDAGTTDPLDPDTDGDGRCDGPRTDDDGDGIDPADPCRWVWFVDASAPSGGDGRSWASAFRNPPTYAVAGDNDVWVRAGTYRPTAASAPVLELDGAMRVYGGFAGTESTFADRPASLLPTILDGDRDQSGTPTAGDANHVIRAWGGEIVDGFVATGGNSTFGGAGMYASSVAGLVASHLTIEDNVSSDVGGGVYARFSTLSLVDSVVRGNAAADDGGGIAVEGGEVTLARVELDGNVGLRGGGLSARVAAVDLADVDIHDNETLDAGAGAGVFAYGATIAGTGVRVERNAIVNDVGAPPCSMTGLTGGGGLFVAAGADVDLVDVVVSRNRGDNAGSGACLGAARLALRDLRAIDNHASGIVAFRVLAGGDLSLVDAEVVGSSPSLVEVAGAGSRLAIVNADIVQRSSIIAVQVQDAVSTSIVGSSLDGMSFFQASATNVVLSHVIAEGPLFVAGSHLVEHSAAPGLTGATNADVASDPFIRADLDGDGAPELYLKHTGLDGQTANGPGVDTGSASALDARLSPYALDWRTGSTRSDGALDTGAPDLGRHHP